MENCVYCGEGDDVGALQLCDGCDTAFHIDAPCDKAVLGKPFELTGEDILCAECTDEIKKTEAAAKETQKRSDETAKEKGVVDDKAETFIFSMNAREVA